MAKSVMPQEEVTIASLQSVPPTIHERCHPPIDRNDRLQANTESMNSDLRIGRNKVRNGDPDAAIENHFSLCESGCPCHFEPIPSTVDLCWLILP
jgi:hypothetical protein